jgi:hypothetical protein
MLRQDYPDEAEEKLINEEYKIWKKNTPFLYGGGGGRGAGGPSLGRPEPTWQFEGMAEKGAHRPTRSTSPRPTPAPQTWSSRTRWNGRA